MIDRHPAGRSCALALLVAGVLTATGLTGLFAVASSGGPVPTVNAPLPAAVVATVTTTAAPTSTATQTTTAPAVAPHVAVDPTTTQETTVANPPTNPPAGPPPATDVNGVRIAPSNPNANQDPGKPGAKNGVDANGNPVGPSPQVTPGGQVPQGQPPVG